MEKTGNCTPTNNAISESNTIARKTSKVTAPGCVQINNGQRTDTKKQYLALHGGSGSDGGSEGCKIKRSDKGDMSDDTKKTRCTGRIYDIDNTTWGKKKRGAEGHNMAQSTPEKSRKRSNKAVGLGGRNTQVRTWGRWAARIKDTIQVGKPTSTMAQLARAMEGKDVKRWSIDDFEILTEYVAN